MSELSAVGKIKRAMRLAKLAEVGMTLSYFDVIELLGEIESLEETIRILDTRDDDALVTAYRKDNAELKRKVERLDAHNTYLLESIAELKMHAVNAGREVRDLKCKLAMADHDNSTLADESIAYKERAEKAEALIKSLIAVGNIILNQDGKLDDDIKLAEAVWRVLVGQGVAK
jgi:predicted RNase H-like nuclease (RuvC/YqgF family)